MSGSVRVDVRQLERLNRRLQRFAQADIDKFCEDCARELAAQLLRKVIKRTPVGDYSREVTVTAKRNSKYHKRGDQYKKKVNASASGKTGGTLRRGWTAATHKAAAEGSGRGVNPTEFAQSVRVRWTGSLCCIRIFNPVEYFPYVEYGHRKVNGKGWVPGRFMLTMSVQELQGQAQGIIDRKLVKFLGGVFNGN